MEKVGCWLRLGSLMESGITLYNSWEQIVNAL
jgi:hypothetical protein